ncbi:ATP-grasp domain-containing protein [Arthrobacter sp. I2-34]|uniref:biotin carboxylase n=1 Tax=Arthrobacter hankyongi TaxID=2904801 RepID=A0ABS9L446_9MICC|nr:biotin carboxylase N-terminal domain-containing protein [Arthrobacter hankyongi]MCG2621333.1 ATP-grasp domain-containing protein [Arthrobacter hankyongi]
MDTTGRTSIGTVLIANRGEIAVRVIRTLRQMGIRAVAVYSDADAGAAHVREADEAVRLGPAPAADSYLDIGKVLAAAKATGADAIHPGYGFLSENAGFAEACAQEGLIFLGPPVAAIRTMGDKISAKAAVAARNVPTVPGISRPGLTDEELSRGAGEVGYPVLIKPSAGGGGKGMRRVEDPAGLQAALESARREAASSFGDDTLFLERFVDTPRHIEVQIVADRQGNVIHLGERECSLQRRHQKVIEEAPSPLLDEATRSRIGEAACNAARSVGYVGVGTVEFIVSAHRPEEFFFMEMNTRLQVEHPVTELVTGIDLVQLQVLIAAGEPLPLAQDDVVLRGHAVEARVYAEDPGRGFLPTGGTVLALREPASTPDQHRGHTVRTDSGLRTGTVVGGNYDPMLSKVIAHGATRAEALRHLDRALQETVVLGVRTNIDFCRFLLRHPQVAAGHLDTGLLDRSVAGYAPPAVPDEALLAVAMHRLLDRTGHDPAGGAAARSLWDVPSGWRLGARSAFRTRLDTGDGTVSVALTGGAAAAEAVVGTCEDEPAPERRYAVSAKADAGQLLLAVDGRQSRWTVREAAGTYWIAGRGGIWDLRLAPMASVRTHDDGGASAEITSPMPGTVIAVLAADGEYVEAGTPVLIVEAMKMEHSLTAPVAGEVNLKVGVGDQVVVDQVLAYLAEAPGTAEESDNATKEDI